LLVAHGTVATMPKFFAGLTDAQLRRTSSSRGDQTPGGRSSVAASPPWRTEEVSDHLLHVLCLSCQPLPLHPHSAFRPGLPPCPHPSTPAHLISCQAPRAMMCNVLLFLRSTAFVVAAAVVGTTRSHNQSSRDSCQLVTDHALLKVQPPTSCSAALQEATPPRHSAASTPAHRAYSEPQQQRPSSGDYRGQTPPPRASRDHSTSPSRVSRDWVRLSSSAALTSPASTSMLCHLQSKTRFAL
jgi:hypothetical protein